MDIDKVISVVLLTFEAIVIIAVFSVLNIFIFAFTARFAYITWG